MKKQLTVQEREELKLSFEQSIENNEIVLKKYQELGFEHPIVQSMRNSFLVKQKMAIQYHDFENYKHFNNGVV